MEKKGYQIAALELMSQAKTTIPESLDLQWHWLMLKCRLQGVSNDEFSEIKKVSGEIPFKIHQVNMLQATVETLLNPQCKGANSDNALELLDILQSNPALINDQRRLFQPHHLKGLVFAVTHRPKEALAEYKTVLGLTQNIEHGLVQVGVLASNGFYPEALEHLGDVEKILATQPPANTLFSTKLNYPAEIKRLRLNLITDIKSNQK